MKKLFHFKLKKNILVLMMIICLCPVLSVSYAAFVFNTGEYRASEMYIGKLLYGMKINNEAVSEITVSPGNTEVVIEVTSLNEIGSNYKLVYESNDNLLLRYANDENEPSYGLITTTKTSTILISNTSNEDITVKFNIVGGYKTNDLSEIIIPNTYAEITGDYTKYDFSIMSMYVDDVLVEELDSTKEYNLTDYSCTNGETITWDSSTNTIVVTPLTNQTKCSVYFSEELTIYRAILADNPTIKNDSADLFANVADEVSESGLFRTTDLTKTEDINGDGTGEEVLYFRGVVENNYLVFAGFCWRIVRTNESGVSIKLRYGGEYDSTNNTCPQTGTSVGITVGGINEFTYSYGGLGDDAKYLKWVHEEGMDSNAKMMVEQWYEENIESQGSAVTDLIIDEPFCNDTLISHEEDDDWWYYAPSSRMSSPQYKCPQENDKYSVYNGNINKPIGLLTSDEVIYGGAAYYTYSQSNVAFYLYTESFYWLMSPRINQLSTFYMFSLNASGNLNDADITGEQQLIPVISINMYSLVEEGGTGEYNNPYIVITN